MGAGSDRPMESPSAAGENRPYTFEYDVFLSYSSKDKTIVHALAERLRGDGVRVWLDVGRSSRGSLSPRDRAMRAEAIQHGVEKSRTLVMCMSPDYFESEWGKLEHHSMLFRDPTNAQRRFLPLLIKDCQPPDIIAQFAHIDWRTSEAMQLREVAWRLSLDEGRKQSSRTVRGKAGIRRGWSWKATRAEFGVAQSRPMAKRCFRFLDDTR